MQPTRTQLALLISMIGAGAQAGELTQADLCWVPSAVGCVERRPAPAVEAAPLAEASPLADVVPARSPAAPSARAAPARTVPTARPTPPVPEVRPPESTADAAAPDVADRPDPVGAADAPAAALPGPALEPGPLVTTPRREPAPSPDEAGLALARAEGPRPLARRNASQADPPLAAPPPDDALEARGEPPMRRVAAIDAEAPAVAASPADAVLLDLRAAVANAGAARSTARPGEAAVVGTSESDRVRSGLASLLAALGARADAVDLLLDGAQPLRLDIDLSVAAPLDIDLGIAAPLDIDLGVAEPLDIDLAVAEPLDIDLTASAPAGHAPGEGWVAVDDHALDGMRGGFSTPDGVKFAFGIERAVYINGSLVTSTTLNVVASPGGAPSVQATGDALALVRNGPGNAFLAANVSPGAVGTVIQNTLNDQRIQNLTVIDATVNSLQVLRGMNLQSALRSAVIDSLRR